MTDEEKIMKLKKEKHDLKFEIRQLRERVDKLEQQEIAHRKFNNQMNKTIMMQFGLINALCDLTKGLAEDVANCQQLQRRKNENISDKVVDHGNVDNIDS